MDRTARKFSSSSRSRPYPPASQSPRSHGPTQSGTRRVQSSARDNSATVTRVTGSALLAGSMSSTPDRSPSDMANPPTRRTTPDDSPPYSTPHHYLDVDILVQMTGWERRQLPRLKLKRLALRWATGEKKGEVATLQDVDPGRQHGELFSYIH
jgi:hypothetical protein